MKKLHIIKIFALFLFSLLIISGCANGNGADSRNLQIQTDIESVGIFNDTITFSADALYGKEAVPVIVKRNGNTIEANSGKYSATLEIGENEFIIIARKGDITESRKHTIDYKGFKLISDLKEEITNDKDFSFRAKGKYGDDECSISATVNDRQVLPIGNKYSFELSEGDNKIVIKLIYDEMIKEYSYIVRFLNAPPTFETYIKDNAIYRGSVFSFDIKARDGLGKKLPASAITFEIDKDASDDKEEFVPLSGAIALVWDDSIMTSYKLNFRMLGIQAEAPFNLKIKVFDNAGTVEKIFTMTYVPASIGQQIGKVTFAIEAFTVGLGYLIEPINIEIYEGVPFAVTLTEIITEKGWSYNSTGTPQSGFYLSSISGLDLSGNAISDGIWEVASKRNYKRSIEGDSLGEFDYGSGSGWMYSVNGIFKNYGFSDYYPQDGDVVRVQFTLLLGDDIGGGGAMGGEGHSLLDYNADYAPIMKLLAEISEKDDLDKSVYSEVISVIEVWNISQKVLDEQAAKLYAAYGEKL